MTHDTDPFSERDGFQDYPPRQTKGKTMATFKIEGPGEYVCKNGDRATVVANYCGSWLGVINGESLGYACSWRSDGTTAHGGSEITGPWEPAPPPPTLLERVKALAAGHQTFVQPGFFEELAVEIERLTKLPAMQQVVIEQLTKERDKWRTMADELRETLAWVKSAVCR